MITFPIGGIGSAVLRVIIILNSQFSILNFILHRGVVALYSIVAHDGLR